MFKPLLIFGFFIILQLELSSGVDEKCSVKKTGGLGECKKIKDCPSIKEQLKLNKQDLPTVCDRKEKTVCCPSLSSERISALKCKEYGNYVYENKTVNSLIPGDPDEIQKIDQCAHDTNQLIVGGTIASQREFPHMALIGYDLEGEGISYLCGGSLISERMILSASHCVKTPAGRPKYAKLGSNFRTLNNPESIIKRIIDIKIHENYKGSSSYHDIALFKLSSKVKLSPFIIPICLPQTDDIGASKLMAIGFGTTGIGEDPTNELHKVTLDLFTPDECNDAIEDTSKFKSGVQENIMLCAGSKTDLMKDTCSGDSGAALQVYSKDVHCMYTIIGVTSFGPTICGHVGVYTRVFHYLDWIEKHVWK